VHAAERAVRALEEKVLNKIKVAKILFVAASIAVATVLTARMGEAPFAQVKCLLAFI
jgi:hypothetical protein